MVANNGLSKEQLKQAVCEAIDRHGNADHRARRAILHHPETGFNEIRTAALVADTMRALGLEPQTGLALTGVKGRLRGKAPGPRLAFVGELDSLRTSDHPLADPHTGAAHSCGHNAQVAGMLGVAMGLSGGAGAPSTSRANWSSSRCRPRSSSMSRSGWRARNKGEIEFLLGKPELVAKGHFDDIDMAMMIHIGSHDQMAKRSYIADSSNGALVKQIRFLGRASHAGGAPQLGINALSAAMIALNAIHCAARDLLRQGHDPHPPDHHQGRRRGQRRPGRGARWKPSCAAARCEAIVDANMKVDRCLRAGAMAMGAEVEINTIPGYLPQRNNRAMGELFGANVEAMFGPGPVRHRRPPHRLHRYGRHRPHDAGDPPLCRQRRRQNARRRFSHQRARARLPDPGQAAGDDRDRPPLGRRRPRPQSHRRVQAGLHQGQPTSPSNAACSKPNAGKRRRRVRHSGAVGRVERSVTRRTYRGPDIAGCAALHPLLRVR